MKRLGKLIILAVFLLLLVYLPGFAVAQEQLRYAGQFFEFKHKRMVFIDLIKEDGTPIAEFGRYIIIDKKGGPQESANYEQFKLTENGAFILRFVLQGVDPRLIKDIYMAEYNVDEQTAIKDINALIDNLTRKPSPDLLKKVNKTTRGRTDPKNDPIETKKFDKPLPIKLDVDMNSMGGGGYKIPPR